MPQLAGAPSIFVSADFDVAGLRMHAEAESAELLAPFQSLMGSFQLETSTLTAWHLRISRQDRATSPCPPHDVREIWSGEVPPGWQAVNYVGPGKRRLELIDDGLMDLDLSRREAEVVLSQDCPASRVGYFALATMCD